MTRKKIPINSLIGLKVRVIIMGDLPISVTIDGTMTKLDEKHLVIDGVTLNIPNAYCDEYYPEEQGLPVIFVNL